MKLKTMTVPSDREVVLGEHSRVPGTDGAVQMQTCPKCHHVRKPHETAPDWQCPACGVAYAKAAEAARGAPEARPVIYQAEPERSNAWLKWLLLAALVVAGWATVQAVSKRSAGAAISYAAIDLQALAATAKPGDVVMYSTTECGYCAQARSWLNQNGFAFTECDMRVSSQCEREFLSYGGTGTPYLVVRGHHMKDGFNTDEFLAALAAPRKL